MGFDTSVLLYTPTNPPPRVTTGDLAGFVRGVAEVGVTRPDSRLSAYVKFGESIDQDDEDTSRLEAVPVSGGQLFRVASVPGDISEHRLASLDAVTALLDAQDRHVYRAELRVGTLAPDLAGRLNNGPQDRYALRLGSVMLVVGLVTTGDLETDRPAHVGWIGLRISGQGLSTPHRSHRELVDQVRSDPDIQRLEAFLHEFWRLPEIRVRRPLATARRSLGALWPYDTVDISDPWVWGVSVS